MSKERCPYCDSTQTRFLKRKNKFTCYVCSGDDWEKKEEEEVDG